MKEKKGVALNPLSNLHYLDHLGPVSEIMKIPFLMSEEDQYEMGAKYYPHLNVQLKDRAELHSEYIFEHFDVLFLSDYYAQSRFAEYFLPLEKKFNKNLRIVHCPHGFSDKSFYLKKCAFEDIPLIYGQNMLDMLQESGVFKHLRQYVITGNYRYTYYKQNQKFYEELIQQEILSKFVNKQPIILYAPTWNDSESTTSFYDAASTVLKNLPSNFNMIVKLHPNLEEDDILSVYQLMSQHERRVNVLFLSQFPLVYPLLAHTDIYIGDMSAVGYDFLIFNKPMFFLKTPQTKKRVLYKCGIEVQEYDQLYSLIDKNIANDTEKFSSIRQEVYQYTFGQERSFDEIKMEIEEVCKKNR